ncbi:protein wech isoform X2 [Aricia agestis]|nr:protein wech isoform X2 [Aricia agestis]XP_041984647.1 protein wech isoform X2 [Aricia agestis]
MTSFANLSRTASSVPSTSAAAFGANGSPERDSDLSLLQLQNMSRLSLHSGDSSNSIPSMLFEPFGLPSTSSSVQNATVSTSDCNGASNDNNENHTEASSESIRTSPSLSITCSRCELLTPTIRCVECNDMYCHDCCYKHQSDCQMFNHTLWPIHQIFSSYSNERDQMYCEVHSMAATFCCTSCTELICHECTSYFHKDHCYSPLNGNIDNRVLYDMKSLFQASKTNTKAIKSAIDKAIAMTKAYEKETNEANMKIKSAMQYFVTAIYNREKYLLSQVEQMRQTKMNQLSEYMDTLRGILAGLSHTNETLVRSITSQGIDVNAANERGKQEIESFSTTFRRFWVNEERIVFIPPNKDLAYQISRQCSVQSVLVNPMRSLSTSVSDPPRQLTPRPPRSESTFSQCTSSTSSLSIIQPPRSTRTVSPTLSPLDLNFARGIGQAIPGYNQVVSIKLPRSSVSGSPMFSFGPEGPGEGQVSRPWGLCIDKDGNFIVADRRNNRIQIFNRQGDFRGMFGTKGNGPGEFELPAGITTDPYGRIIVVDKDNHRVQIFTASGRFLLKFGSFGRDSGQFQYPWDVAVNSLGNIAVTDTRNHRIQLFSSDGAFLTKFVFEGFNPARLLKGPTTPRGICFTTTGNIVVSDFENHRLLVVDPTLSRIIYCFGREGSSLGEFNRPSGMICDDNGNLIVADSKNHRLLVLNAELRIMLSVNLKSPGLDDKDRPCDVALTPEGYLVVLFETLPDNARDFYYHRKLYIKVY